VDHSVVFRQSPSRPAHADLPEPEDAKSAALAAIIANEKRLIRDAEILSNAVAATRR